MLSSLWNSFLLISLRLVARSLWRYGQNRRYDFSVENRHNPQHKKYGWSGDQMLNESRIPTKTFFTPRFTPKLHVPKWDTPRKLLLGSCLLSAFDHQPFSIGCINDQTSAKWHIYGQWGDHLRICSNQCPPLKASCHLKHNGSKPNHCDGLHKHCPENQ